MVMRFQYKLYALGFILLLLYPFLEANCQPADRWQAGSASTLKGETISFFCFLETNENPWTSAEREKTINLLGQSQSWLAEQANSWNVSLTCESVDLLEGETLKIMTIPSGTGSGAERVDWASLVLKHAGFRNAKHAYKKLSKAFQSKNIQLLIFAKEDGISYAMRYAKGMNKKKYFLETMLIYQRYDNGAEMPVEAIIAHETLHLYGAWDLYATYAQSREKQEAATIRYPNDIMLRVGYDMDTLKVDKLTAWLIGWNQTEEREFEWFRPTDFKK